MTRRKKSLPCMWSCQVVCATIVHNHWDEGFGKPKNSGIFFGKPQLWGLMTTMTRIARFISINKESDIWDPLVVHSPIPFHMIQILFRFYLLNIKSNLWCVCTFIFLIMRPLKKNNVEYILIIYKIWILNGETLQNKWCVVEHTKKKKTLDTWCIRLIT